ncbi:hypothetical protein D9M69_656410 [compost metagenome]
MARQQAAQGGKVDLGGRGVGLGRQFLQHREVDHHRLLLEEVGRIRQLGVERLGQHVEVGCLEDHCDQRQCGALEFENRLGTSGGNIGHWKTCVNVGAKSVGV